MGRFSATVQLKDNVGRMKFINSFCDVMKKRGFVPCSEDEVAMSYLLAFSDGGWVTLTSESYADNPKKAEEDAQQISAEMKTSGFSVEVVDSDFAILTLNGKDRVIVGDGSGYGIEDAPKGDKKLWEPLLAEGGTWEQLSESVNKNEVFVEDALCETASVLGIDPQYMCADHRDFSDMADSDENITAFYFKKVGGEKVMTLNAAFIKVFGEALEPLGFKKIKSRYPYFVRVVNNEIIHIITYRKMSGNPVIDYVMRRDCGQYDIVGKVETIYSPKIEFPTSHLERCLELLSNSEIYSLDHAFDFDNKFRIDIMYHPFKLQDNNLTLNSLENALKVTRQNMLPALDSVSDLSSYMEFIYKFRCSHFLEYEKGKYDHFSEYSGLVQIMADTCESYIERRERYLELEIDMDENSCKRRLRENQLDSNVQRLTNSLNRIKERRAELEASKGKRREMAFDMFNDKEWCQKALEELDRRKAANIEKLKEFGLEF